MTNPIETLPLHRLFQRVRRLNMAHWLLLVEVVALLAGASLAIGLLPFRRVIRLASRPMSASRSRCRDRIGLRDLVWAIDAVSRRVPWRTVCFQKGLALHLMLRKRGISSLLHYGVGKSEEHELAAHVWISVGGQIVLGGDVVDRFSCLATYPAVV